jgi:TonB family protein
MITFKTAFALSVLVAAPAFAAEPPATACSPRFVSTHTDFPAAARNFGAHGVVHVDIRLGADGRPAEAQVRKSSGHRALDQAAIDSVRNRWRFDVAQCSELDLAVQRTVEVHFRRPVRNTVSGTVNRKAPAETQELLARNRCDIARDARDTTIYSCVKNSGRELAGKEANLATPPARP